MQHVINKTRVTGEERLWLQEIPGCESTWSPVAYSPGQEARTPAERTAVWNAGASSMGLFQFEKPTWLNLPAWISRHSIWNPLWSTWAAWWLYRHDGNGREWSCTARLGLY